MNKAIACLTGLATVLLSQPAFAIGPNINGAASGGHPTEYQTEYSSTNRNHAVRSTPIGTSQTSPQTSSLDGATSNLLPPPTAQPPLGITDPVTGQGDSAVPPPPPIPPKSAVMSPAAPPIHSMPAIQSPDLPPHLLAQPIPSKLGVDFGMTNSPKPLPPAMQPPTMQSPMQSPRMPLENNPSETHRPESAIAPAPVNPQPDFKPVQSHKPEFTLTDLFNGNSDSIVAVIVGNAEGTRRPDGGSNQAFYGHTDPGNGVWNLGTFSYQHGAASPEEADAKQLNRLKRQAQIMQQKAAEKGLQLTLEETLNGIDLANQAPQAVIDAEGYIDWLAKAHAMGKQDAEAILWARVQSFINPKTQQWDAPGLGNTPDRITKDQHRRMEAIANAMNAQDYEISADARLRLQPISFRVSGFLSMVRQLPQKTADLLGLSGIGGWMGQ